MFSTLASVLFLRLVSCVREGEPGSLEYFEQFWGNRIQSAAVYPPPPRLPEAGPFAAHHDSPRGTDGIAPLQRGALVPFLTPYGGGVPDQHSQQHVNPTNGSIESGLQFHSQNFVPQHTEFPAYGQSPAQPDYGLSHPPPHYGQPIVPADYQHHYFLPSPPQPFVPPMEHPMAQSHISTPPQRAAEYRQGSVAGDGDCMFRSVVAALHGNSSGGGDQDSEQWALRRLAVRKLRERIHLARHDELLLIAEQIEWTQPYLAGKQGVQLDLEAFTQGRLRDRKAQKALLAYAEMMFHRANGSSSRWGTALEQRFVALVLQRPVVTVLQKDQGAELSAVVYLPVWPGDAAHPGEHFMPSFLNFAELFVELGLREIRDPIVLRWSGEHYSPVYEVNPPADAIAKNRATLQLLSYVPF